MYLLDTHVISELRKRKPHGAVVAWHDAYEHLPLYISAVSIGEIQTGIERTRAQDPAKSQDIERWLGRIMANYEILPMNALCFKQWAELMHQESDTRIMDAMIAATAKTFNLTVVTRNVGDFEHFGCAVLNPFEYQL